MRPLDPLVSRDRIDAEIHEARYPGHAPARWALPLIDQLDAGADGWMLVELNEADFGALWLPEHAGEACHGDVMQLGDTPGGHPLEEAASWLALHADAYAAANPSCWGRISHAAQAPTTAIVVSPAAVGDRVKPAHVPLVVVDGLHRALAYWVSGRRTCPAYLPRLPGR
jgi:hypothetical protein